MSDMLKLFKIRGGVHPDGRKHLSADQAIAGLPMPALLHIPLQQHIGAAADPLVQRGGMVKKGQMLARSQGMISAPVHAPTSGRIVGVGSFPAHHASGLSVRTITLKPDGLDEWCELPEVPDDPFSLSAEEISRRVAEAGIVGMGGATFPSAVKLDLRKRYELHTLVVNGAECEPYLTCDDRLMREHPDLVLDGVRIMAHALGVKRVLIGIENNKPKAQAALRKALQPSLSLPRAVSPREKNFESFLAGGNTPSSPVSGSGGETDIHIQVVGLPIHYPMGSEKHLVQTLTGRETPARGLTADIGVVVHNVATALAVHEALRYGKPLISRVVTVSGQAVEQPRNLRVLIGTPLQTLIDYCGGFVEDPVKLISGGPMMGQPLPSTRVPVVKGSSGLLALTAAEIVQRQTSPCIRCASCVQACPCGLVPLEMAANIRAGSLDASVKLGLMDCVACGSCAYVCPSHIPLVQYFNYAKGELASRQRAQHKQNEIKRLAESRSERMEAIKRAKKEEMARRKAEMAAKKKQEAAETEARAPARQPEGTEIQESSRAEARDPTEKPVEEYA